MPRLSDAIIGPMRRRRRTTPTASERELPPPVKAAAVLERAPPAAEAPDEVDGEDGDIEAAIDERLVELNGKEREQVLRRVIAKYAETDANILNAVDDAATEARDMAQEQAASAYQRSR